ncbi:phage replisome organizer N-terminal domain-containing protein [Streptococcus anginosus]|uniref:DnaD domain protein n=1 Tax=Streptococcus anginosus TaxID=1328 RepID=A0A6G4N056_STRAP|nr:phage replisome organizer N-terminal domain-containing protein [Streptococcus anginosus]MCW0988464.1 phage replisome organizer N-terminal domain-containing protein [Streptococcus anginosus]NGG16700.1 DnaD domain protein [Streptococcus anginosus]NGG24039.1 DnaD domain protein [Streptococcus anginosus]
MSEIKWIKITTDIFDDEKIRLIDALPEHDAILVIWFKILTLAGRQGGNGLLMMNNKIHYTDEMLAAIFGRPITTIRLALQTFEQFGMIEIINGIISLPNWEKHQNVDGMEKAKEQTRKRVARYREKQKQLLENGNVTCNVTVTPCNATDIDIEIDTDREKDKDNIVVDKQNFIQEIEANLGRGLVKFEFDMINDYLLNQKVSTELFLEAVKIAVANNVRKFNYIARILDNWINQGIRTPEQAYQAQRDFQAKKNNRVMVKNQKAGNNPDWSNPDYKNETSPEKQAELEKQKQELLKRLEKKDGNSKKM